MSGDTEREALAKAVADAQNVPFAGPKQRKIADAILAEFLPAHGERVRAKQRETASADLDALIDRYRSFRPRSAIREASDD